jgi:hypothetical protein
MTEAYDRNSDTIAGTGNAGVTIEGNYLALANPGATGARTATVSAFNDSGVTATIVLQPTNSAPVLDATKAPALANVAEDAPAPSGAVGTAVSSLIDYASPTGQVDNFTDLDATTKFGIAITAADATNCTWFFSTNGGTNWTAFPALTTDSLLLEATDPNTRIYCQPSANFNGTVSTAITFRAWDTTTGTSGTTADTSANGGTTAYSTETDTASLTITAVDDAPSPISTARTTSPRRSRFRTRALAA